MQLCVDFGKKVSRKDPEHFVAPEERNDNTPNTVIHRLPTYSSFSDFFGEAGSYNVCIVVTGNIDSYYEA